MEWMNLLGDDIRDEKVQEAFCRCTLAGLYSPKELPISLKTRHRFTESQFLRGVFGEWAKNLLTLHRGQSRDVLKQAIKFQSKTFPASDGMVKIWPECLQKAQLYRTFFICGSGIMDLGPDVLKIGDSICVLLGCRNLWFYGLPVRDTSC